MRPRKTSDATAVNQRRFKSLMRHLAILIKLIISFPIPSSQNWENLEKLALFWIIYHFFRRNSNIVIGAPNF